MWGHIQNWMNIVVKIFGGLQNLSVAGNFLGQISIDIARFDYWYRGCCYGWFKELLLVLGVQVVRLRYQIGGIVYGYGCSMNCGNIGGNKGLGELYWIDFGDNLFRCLSANNLYQGLSHGQLIILNICWKWLAIARGVERFHCRPDLGSG